MEKMGMKSREDYKRQADKFDEAVAKYKESYYGTDGYDIYLEALDSTGLYHE